MYVWLLTGDFWCGFGLITTPKVAKEVLSFLFSSQASSAVGNTDYTFVEASKSAYVHYTYFHPVSSPDPDVMGH